VNLPQNIDYSLFIYGKTDSRYGLPCYTKRYSGNWPVQARTEYWFGGLQNWKSGNCTLTTWNAGLWTSAAPKRTLSNFPIIGRFTVHQLMQEPLYKIMSAIQDDGMASCIDVENTRTVGGTYVCRGVRGGSTASPHSWGIAIDINPNHHLRNGKEVLDKSNTNYNEASPPSLVAISTYFTRMGFTWGGHWQNPKDPMHFEITPLTLLILAEQYNKLPQAFVERCGGIQKVGIKKKGYPPAGTAVKIVMQYGDAYEYIGDGIYNGEYVEIPIRFLETITKWSQSKVGGPYVFNVVDHIIDQNKVYVVVRKPQDNG